MSVALYIEPFNPKTGPWVPGGFPIFQYLIRFQVSVMLVRRRNKKPHVISSLYFVPRLQRRDAAAGRSPRLWVSITNPLGRRGPHVASVPSIWSERSTRCGAQSAVGRAKKASVRMGERYATGTISVFRAAKEG